MNITTRRDKDCAVLDLSGRLTAGEGGQDLRNQVDVLLQQGVRHLVLNLAGIELMDSSGLGELVATRQAAQAVGGQVKLLHVGPQLQPVMTLAHLGSTFELFDRETDAVASFR